MKIDLYTKVILTVIAACLVANLFRGTPIIEEAQAQQPAQNVVWLAGWVDRGGGNQKFDIFPLPTQSKQ
ncbi:MAG: hypothetical protein CMO55_14465 [Verrucomicrobiales bacterium]|nr:hypothetical protein [Verrucomicrobiales bacterium]